MSSNHTTFDQLKTTGKLPSPSGVALRIIELCRREGSSIQEIAHAVQADPSLSGRLIKFANSAVHGPRRPVVAVADAIRVSGINTVRQLVLGFSLLGQNKKGRCAHFDYHRFWSRCLAVAIAANALCLRLRPAQPEEAFTCGLLSDIGSLALATVYPDQYSQVLAENTNAGSSAMLRAERHAFRTDHRELGAALQEDWMLPRVFVNAIVEHEDPEHTHVPEGSREYTLVHLLHLAARIGTFCIADESARKQLVNELVLKSAKIGLDSDALAMLTDQVASEWRDWGKILEVTTQQIPPFEEHVAANESAAPATDRTKPILGAEPLDILVVDDDPAAVILLEHLLKDQGHRVIKAQDGKEALRLALERTPQLVISDWVMPEMEGVTLCKALRDTEPGQHMYFILLTGMVHDDQLVEAFEAGVDDFLTKPFNPRVLSARLRAAHRVIQLQEEARRDSQNLRKFSTELAVANRRLQLVALTDSLTGLPNRRHAMERLDQEWAAASRAKRPLSVMMIDVDSFKSINDSYGHEAGDEVLRQLAVTLRKALRTEDVTCRFGGEEFIVIAAATPPATAQQVAERLRESIALRMINLGSATLRVTVSIGIGSRLPGMSRIDEMLRAADAALYRAKRDGRNRVCGPEKQSGQAAS